MATITVQTDPPSAHLVYEAADLPVGAATIRVTRTCEGVTTTLRDGLDKPCVGGVIVDDGEMPVGADVIYEGTVHDASYVELGTTDFLIGNVPTPYGVAWLSDPRDATSGVRVDLDVPAMSSLSRPTPGQRYQVGFQTIVLAGQTQLLTDLPMDFVTDDADTRDAVTSLMQDTGGLILIRTPPPLPVPRLLYCWASNPTSHPLSLQMQYETHHWENTVQEISEIPGTTQVFTVTWQTYMDAFPTWGDMAAAYTSWFDAAKNPPGGA